MAKVMVSMPEELLAEVDAEAQRLETSRSAVLRGFAEAALRRRRADRAGAIRELLREATAGHAGNAGYGGDVAELVKATRPEP